MDCHYVTRQEITIEDVANMDNCKTGSNFLPTPTDEDILFTVYKYVKVYFVKKVEFFPSCGKDFSCRRKYNMI
jgi:hypothetical protein